MGPEGAREKLGQIQSVLTPHGLRALADAYQSEAAAPEGVVGLLRAAAEEIAVSREEIRRLTAVLTTVTEERDLLSGGMGPGNWPKDSTANRKLRDFRDSRVREDRDRWRSNHQQQKVRADRLAERLAQAEAVVREARALIPSHGEALPPPLASRVREILGDLLDRPGIEQPK